MNKGQFFELGEEGELHEIGESKEIETLLQGAINEQIENINVLWKHVEKQITLATEN